MGHTTVSNSSLRPPVSDGLGLGALFCLLGSQRPGTDSTIAVVGNKPRQMTLFIYSFSEINPVFLILIPEEYMVPQVHLLCI